MRGDSLLTAPSRPSYDAGLTCRDSPALRLVLLVSVLASFWGGVAWPQGADERVVRVAAAADLKFALDDILQAFERQHADITTRATYGSSGNFFAQLSNRAPFDIYFSADVDYPRWLIAQGVALKETEFLYAVGRIVVWVPRQSPLDLDRLGMQAIIDPSVRKIAIANPKHAPYGRAAEAAMKTLGVYEPAQARFVLGENIAQTAQFVQSRAADIGIIALALALAPALRDEGRYWEIPLDAYPRMNQGGVILPWAKDMAATRALRTFVLGSEGKDILRRYGFFLPGE
ncbi:MAG TPA: molybdate ABC transporter substrate-binding protein [Candidatus Tectomicrobia bacterium]|nr:molybdate ABC transporter substrate-binding protein [Candidatus Tectomicrobia bacterium]